MQETNQTIIEGMGELHLDIIVDRLKREFKVEATVGAPQVNYREAITEPAGALPCVFEPSSFSHQCARVCEYLLCHVHCFGLWAICLSLPSHMR